MQQQRLSSATHSQSLAANQELYVFSLYFRSYGRDIRVHFAGWQKHMTTLTHSVPKCACQFPNLQCTCSHTNRNSLNGSLIDIGPLTLHWLLDQIVSMNDPCTSPSFSVIPCFSQICVQADSMTWAPWLCEALVVYHRLS